MAGRYSMSLLDRGWVAPSEVWIVPFEQVRRLMADLVDYGAMTAVGWDS